MKNSEQPIHPQSEDWQKDMEAHFSTKGKTGHPSLFGIGLAKREYFAGLAMQGLTSNPDWAKQMNVPNDWEEYSKRLVGGAIELADELLKQLES